MGDSKTPSLPIPTPHHSLPPFTHPPAFSDSSMPGTSGSCVNWSTAAALAPIVIPPCSRTVRTPAPEPSEYQSVSRGAPVVRDVRH